MENNRKPNRLIKEKSPYLLQHAFNPVDWYPWCDEAFKRAKEEDKPIFLSIGYSTCHWCHVMERESFEDAEIARLMNDVFINIKVDREERPDLDEFYMNICTMMTGSGGWPLTIIMTPEKRPFFAGTYFPKDSRYGRVGLKELIPRIKELWKKERSKLMEVSNRMVEVVSAVSDPTKEKESIDKESMDKAYEYFKGSYDKKFGGFGGAPKFPSPHNLLFLMNYYLYKREHEALDMVRNTLLRMSLGGIFDHIGYGFHRYSTDRYWLLPHFEKMLYDQALLLLAYTEAYQLTKEELFRDISDRISEYVINRLYSKDEGFYSSEDADTEGEEGKYYLWTQDELKELLGEEAEFVITLFNIKRDGNFREEATGRKTGKNILYLKEHPSLLAEQLNIEYDEFKEKWNRIRKILLDHRNRRTPPFRDEKIMCDWNGLMVAGLSKCGLVLKSKEYIDVSRSVISFILRHMIADDGILFHMYKDGELKTPGNLLDYNCLIWGLFNLYDATLESDYIIRAKNLIDKMIQLFWDPINYGFFLTSEQGTDISIRSKPVYDGAIPSGNSIAYNNLIRIFHITSDRRYLDLISRMEDAFGAIVNRFPHSMPMFLCGYMRMNNGGFSIVLSGSRKDAEEFYKRLIEICGPVVDILYMDDKISNLTELGPNFSSKEGELRLQVCDGFSCIEVNKTPDEFLNDLEEEWTISTHRPV